MAEGILTEGTNGIPHTIQTPGQTPEQVHVALTKADEQDRKRYAAFPGEASEGKQGTELPENDYAAFKKEANRRDAEGENTSREVSQDKDAPAHSKTDEQGQSGPLSLSQDHPHLARQKAALEYYGEDRIRQLVERAQQQNADVLPGVARQIADLPNSMDVTISLLQEPNVCQWLNTLPPPQAKRELEKISAIVAGEEPAPKAPETRAWRPPSEVGGRGSAPEDAATSAAQNKDYRSYKAEMNRRDADRMKRGY